MPPHVHGEAWITTVYGAKKWYLYAPGSVPQAALPDPLTSLQHWETEILPGLTEVRLYNLRPINNAIIDSQMRVAR